VKNERVPKMAKNTKKTAVSLSPVARAEIAVEP
jgi:hypothetical protein